MREHAASTKALFPVLREAGLFQGVDLAAVQPLLQEARILQVKAGQVLLDPKHRNTDIYIVLTGELLVCLEPRVANPLARMGPGDCVGELSIIDAEMPSAYVVAAAATGLLAIPKPVLWRMLAVQQVMALNLLHVLSRRIRENNHVLLGSLFLITALLGLFISNTATAVLMAPVALGMADKVQASPYPFAMIVALAASTAFMTPISSPVNALVAGPGDYAFFDFVKLGVPFALLVLAISVALVPILLPP